MIKTKEALKANKNLLSYPVMKPIDTMIARSLVEFITYTLTFVALIYGSIYFDLIKNINNFDYIIIAITLASLYGLFTGILLAALIALWDTTERLIDIISRTLFFTSGIFFSLSMLPRKIREIAEYNPILNITEMARHGVLSSFPDTYFHLGYTLYCLLVIAAASILMLSFAEKNPKAHIRGPS